MPVFQLQPTQSFSTANVMLRKLSKYSTALNILGLGVRSSSDFPHFCPYSTQAFNLLAFSRQYFPGLLLVYFQGVPQAASPLPKHTDPRGGEQGCCPWRSALPPPMERNTLQCISASRTALQTCRYNPAWPLQPSHQTLRPAL